MANMQHTGKSYRAQLTWGADLAITNINVVNPWAEISSNLNPIEHIWEHSTGQLVMSELEASAIRQ